MKCSLNSEIWKNVIERKIKKMEISPICFLCIVIIFLTEIIVLSYESYKSNKYRNKMEMTKFDVTIGENFHKRIEAKTADEAIKIAWELWKKEQKTLDK